MSRLNLFFRDLGRDFSIDILFVCIFFHFAVPIMIKANFKNLNKYI